MYKLWEHLLDGGGSISLGLGKDIKRPLWLLDEAVAKPDGYRDFTSITNLDTWGHKAYGADYLRIRATIAAIAKQKANDNYLAKASSNSQALSFIEPDTEADFVHFSTEDSIEQEGLWAHDPGYFVRYDIQTDNWSKEHIADVGFDYCNTSEKAICLKYAIVSTAKLLAHGYMLDRIIEEGKVFHVEAINARQARLITASIYIWNVVPANAQEVLQVFVNPMFGNMYFLYKEFGIKGTKEDYDSIRNTSPGPGPLDYILGRAIWQNNGIAQQTWKTTTGQPIAEFATDLANMLI